MTKLPANVNSKMASELARIVTFNFVDMVFVVSEKDRHFPMSYGSL